MLLISGPTTKRSSCGAGSWLRSGPLESHGCSFSSVQSCSGCSAPKCTANHVGAVCGGAAERRFSLYGAESEPHARQVHLLSSAPPSTRPLPHNWRRRLHSAPSHMDRHCPRAGPRAASVKKLGCCRLMSSTSSTRASQLKLPCSTS